MNISKQGHLENERSSFLPHIQNLHIENGIKSRELNQIREQVGGKEELYKRLLEQLAEEEQKVELLEEESNREKNRVEELIQENIQLVSTTNEEELNGTMLQNVRNRTQRSLHSIKEYIRTKDKEVKRIDENMKSIKNFKDINSLKDTLYELKDQKVDFHKEREHMKKIKQRGQHMASNLGENAHSIRVHILTEEQDSQLNKIRAFKLHQNIERLYNMNEKMEKIAELLHSETNKIITEYNNLKKRFECENLEEINQKHERSLVVQDGLKVKYSELLSQNLELTKIDQGLDRDIEMQKRIVEENRLKVHHESIETEAEIAQKGLKLKSIYTIWNQNVIYINDGLDVIMAIISKAQKVDRKQEIGNKFDLSLYSRCGSDVKGDALLRDLSQLLLIMIHKLRGICNYIYVKYNHQVTKKREGNLYVNEAANTYMYETPGLGNIHELFQSEDTIFLNAPSNRQGSLKLSEMDKFIEKNENELQNIPNISHHGPKTSLRAIFSVDLLRKLRQAEEETEMGNVMNIIDKEKRDRYITSTGNDDGKHKNNRGSHTQTEEKMLKNIRNRTEIENGMIKLKDSLVQRKIWEEKARIDIHDPEREYVALARERIKNPAEYRKKYINRTPILESDEQQKTEDKFERIAKNLEKMKKNMKEKNRETTNTKKAKRYENTRISKNEDTPYYIDMMLNVGRRPYTATSNLFKSQDSQISTHSTEPSAHTVRKRISNLKSFGHISFNKNGVKTASKLSQTGKINELLSPNTKTSVFELYGRHSMHSSGKPEGNKNKELDYFEASKNNKKLRNNNTLSLNMTPSLHPGSFKKNVTSFGTFHAPNGSLSTTDSGTGSPKWYIVGGSQRTESHITANEHRKMIENVRTNNSLTKFPVLSHSASGIVQSQSNFAVRLKRMASAYAPIPVKKDKKSNRY